MRTTLAAALQTLLRVSLAGEPSVREQLQVARAASEATSVHQAAPFDAIVNEIRPEQSLRYQPLVQVLLVFEPQPPAVPPVWEISPAVTPA